MDKGEKRGVPAPHGGVRLLAAMRVSRVFHLTQHIKGYFRDQNIQICPKFMHIISLHL